MKNFNVCEVLDVVRLDDRHRSYSMNTYRSATKDRRKNSGDTAKVFNFLSEHSMKHQVLEEGIYKS